MKKLLSVALLSFFCIITTSVQTHAATPLQLSPQSTYEYLEDTSYFRTTIYDYPTSRSVKTKKASKKVEYLNANNVVMWSVTITAEFSYTGSSSTCTSASESAVSNNANWKITSHSSSRSGNVGTATATAKKYTLSVPIDTITKSVSLRCDKNGNLS